MVEQNNNECCEYANKYIFEIRHLADMIECKDNAAFVSSLREDFGKLGLFSSAANFLRLMYEIRASSEDKETLRIHISVMAMEALLTLSWYIVSDYNDIIESQIELFKPKISGMETHFRNVLLKMVIRMPSVICKRRLIVFALC